MSHYDAPDEPAAVMIADMLDGELTGDGDDLSDDAGLMWIQDATQICEAHGIDRDRRADVIIEGVRHALEQELEKNMTDLRYQLKLILSL